MMRRLIFLLVTGCGVMALAQTPTTTCNVTVFNAGSFSNDTRMGNINRWHNAIGVSDAIGNFIRYKGGTIQALHIPVPGDTPSMTYRNAFGVTVGFFFDNNFGEHGFMYSNGQTTVIDYPGGTNTEVRGINRYGTMVGVAGSSSNPLFAFVDRGGKFTMIDVGPDPDPATISDTGVIIGNHSVAATGGGTVQHGFIYVNGKVQDVSFPGADETMLRDINASGVIVGVYHKFLTGGAFTQGTFLIRNGQFVEATLPGDFAELNGINGFGEVSGTTNGPIHKEGFVGTCP